MATKPYLPELCISFASVVFLSVIARENWGLVIAASLGVAIMLTTAIRRTAAEGGAARWWRLGLLALCHLLIGLVSYYWVMANGFVFTRDFGESFSVFLAAHNARDFYTVLLQDMSTDTDPVGHPFLYIHQPSLVARLASVLLQAFGLGIPANMALNAIVATWLLWTMANALGKHVPWSLVVGAVLFAVCNYALFHENVVDLTRAPAYFALFGGMTIVANDPHLRHGWSQIALATSIGAAAATDFAVCGFVLYVLAGTHIWLSKALRWRSLLFCFVGPCVVFYGLYFGSIVAAMGLKFFVMDIAFSYLGRAGQILPALSSLSWVPNLPGDLETIRRLYQEAGVVLWQRPRQVFGVGDLVASIASSWRQQASGFVALGMGIASATSVVLSVGGHHHRGFITFGGIVFIGVSAGLKLPLLVFIVIPVLFVFMLPRVDVPSAVINRLTHRLDAAERARNALVLTAIATMAVVAVASVFPEYVIRFIISERRGVPAPLVEMLSFGLLLYLGFEVIRCGGASNRVGPVIRLTIVASGVTLLVFVVWFVVQTNLKLYLSSPPRAPAYASVLSEPVYKHEPFVTTSFYGQAWYFTRGWAYMVPNPPQKPFVDYWDLRHLRDWKNVDKYGRPHYFLCDATHLRGYGPWLPPPAPCSMDSTCNCIDIAGYMRDRGYAAVVVQPDFAIIDVRNINGALHRPSVR